MKARSLETNKPRVTCWTHIEVGKRKGVRRQLVNKQTKPSRHTLLYLNAVKYPLTRNSLTFVCLLTTSYNCGRGNDSKMTDLQLIHDQ